MNIFLPLIHKSFASLLVMPSKKAEALRNSQSWMREEEGTEGGRTAWHKFLCMLGTAPLLIRQALQV